MAASDNNLRTFTDATVINVDCCLFSDSVSLPAYAYPGDAAVDLCSTIDCSIAPGERACIPCGFALALPEGYAGLVLSRSGLAAKHGVCVLNSPGLIDSGYRGEIKVVLINHDLHETFNISCKDRIAQLMIVRIPHITLQAVDNLPDSIRGLGGFGSSGV